MARDAKHLITLEIGSVESQDPKDVVGQHQGNQPCVVDLDTRDAEAHDQIPPAVVGFDGFGQA